MTLLSTLDTYWNKYGRLKEVLWLFNICHCASGHPWLYLMLYLSTDISKPNEQIIKEVIQAVRDSVGPVAAFKRAIIVTKLPKTRSGKISRQTVAAMANKEPFKVRIKWFFKKTSWETCCFHGSVSLWHLYRVACTSHTVHLLCQSSFIFMRLFHRQL